MIELVFCLVLQSQASIPAAEVQGPPTAEPRVHGLAADKPGTERWLVTFRSRSFDLKAFRAANLSGASGEAVARIVRDLERRVTADQTDFVAFIEKLGGAVTAQWWLINGCAVEIPAAKVGELRKHPRVLKIDPEELVYPVGFIKVSTNSKNHNVDVLQASGIKGKGVTVAIMDTGLDNPMAATARPHRTFFIDGNVNNTTGGGIGGSRLLANKTYGRVGPDDVHNHGTGVAGIAAGEVWGSSGADRGHSPLSGVAGYCIADSSSGGAQFQNIVNAWQAIAADAAALKIVSANNSYTGSPDPTHASQQALDSAALNAGVLPVCAAGNSGSSTGVSQSAANGLAVAAIYGEIGGGNDKKVATFSSRGPLSGDFQRFYPDISANGVQTVMPLRNNEADNYVASGTSMASPQVCGAAALFRSVRTSTTLETKAALLATTEDISPYNKSAPYNSRNAYGMGYLRDDRAIALAQGGGLISKGQLTNAQKTFTTSINVTKDKAYAVAVAWNRYVLASKNWSNVDLEIKIGGKVIAFSKSPRNLYEKAVLIATATGKADIVVTGVTLEQASVDFGLAAVEVPPPFLPGDLVPYGKGCLGTGQEEGVQDAVPAQYKAAFGNSLNSFAPSYRAHRYQQITDQKGIAATFTATGMAYRHDDQAFSTLHQPSKIELQIEIGPTTKPPAAMDRTFANNRTHTLTMVLPRTTLNLPQLTAANSDPKKWALQIPFTTRLVFIKKATEHMLLDVTKFSTTHPRGYDYFYTDGFFDPSSVPASRCYSTTLPATQGVVTTGFGAVLGFTRSTSGGAVPLLDHDGVPEIGATYGLSLSQAKANAPVGWILGFSNQKWGAVNLPLALPGSCQLLASIDVLLPGVSDAKGRALATLGVPNDKTLIQGKYFHQVFVVDITANSLGTAFANALAASIGGQP